MSGVLEQMHAAIAALQSDVAALKAALAAAPAAAAAAAAPAAAPAAFGGLGGLGAPAAAPAAATPAVPANVTDEQITALITPYLENDAIKTALGAEMRAMGINALPETQPHQYAELYGRFQRVIQAATTGAAAPAAAPASII